MIVQVETHRTLEELRKSMGPIATRDLDANKVITTVDGIVTDPKMRLSSIRENSVIYYEVADEEF